MKKLFILQWIAILLLAMETIGAQPRKWFVDPDVSQQQTPPPSGDSWTHATTLDYALSQAVAFDTIWCKRGEYKICASVPSNVCLYGGFEGVEDYLSQRELNLDLTCYLPFSSSNNPLPNYYSVLKPSPAFKNTNPYAYWHILSVIGADHVLVDGFIFQDGGSIYTSGGGLYLDFVSTSVFRNLLFLDNFGNSGAGIYANYATDITLENIIFCNNYSTANGGGMFAFESRFHMWNVLFVSNQAKYGGGFFLDNTTAFMYFITTAENIADTGRAGFVTNGTLHVHSSVIYGDTNTIDTIYVVPNSFFEIVYNKSILFPIASYYQDNTCSNVNPMLENPSDNNCYPKPNSPCINTGDNQHAINKTKDVIGNSRIIGGTVDKGAYEYQQNN